MASRPSQTIGVLLVDDHPTLLWGLQRLIDGEAPRMRVVGTASSADEALSLVAKLDPHVILLDLDLGGKSSIEAIPDLMAASNATVLVLTGTRTVSLHDRAIRAGARGIVRKDEAAETLIKAIIKVHEGEVWLDRGAIGRVFGGPSGADKRQGVRAQSSSLDSLTAREREVVRVLSGNAGESNRTLAKICGMSENTLRNHLSVAYEKLGVRNRLELFVLIKKLEGGEI